MTKTSLQLNASQLALYARLVAAYERRGRAMFDNGAWPEPVHSWFEQGYRARAEHPVPQLGGVELASYAAGREARRRAGGRRSGAAAEKRRVRSIRLDDQRWAVLRQLGMAWLEGVIDGAMVSQEPGDDLAGGATQPTTPQQPRA